jgi:restriction system protein
MSDVWFVRAGKESIYAEDFIQKQIVAIGWADIGDIDPATDKKDLVLLYQQAYPTQSDGSAQVAASQIIRFMKDIKVGDRVMTHDRDKQTYYIGKITSNYTWKPEPTGELSRIREVNWEYQVSRGALSSDTKNTLGAIQTLFLVKGSASSEIQSKQLPI